MIAPASEEVSILHALPGRLRVHLSAWSGGDHRRLEKELRQVAGVERVAANRLTRNVLVVFDHQRVSRDRLLGELRRAQSRRRDTTELTEVEERLPSVLREWPVDPGQRVRVAVRGLDCDPQFAEAVVRRLEAHAGVHAEAIPLTGHVLLECGQCEVQLEELLAEIAELEPPSLGDERWPAHPLDAAPLAQAVVRMVGSLLGLGWIAAQSLSSRTAAAPGAKHAATVAAVIGLLRSFPTVRSGMRSAVGQNLADATFHLAGIVSLAAARSPLGLAVMSIEAYVLLRQVLAQRAAWQRYEQCHGVACETRPGAVLRLEMGDRVPVPAQVTEGTGVVIGRDAMPEPIRPEMRLPAGSRIAGGGPLVVRLGENGRFTPHVRPVPHTEPLAAGYLRWLGPASFGYAAIVGLTSRSFARTFNSLLLVNPRTALGGTEAANLDAVVRVVRGGAVVVGSRPDHPIERPDLLLLDGVRLLSDGMELSHLVPLVSQQDDQNADGARLLALAASVAAAAGSPWGNVFPRNGVLPATAGKFDGAQAIATIDGEAYCLRPAADHRDDLGLERFRQRGEYLLELAAADAPRPLAIVALRPKLSVGVQELVQTCRRHGVRVGIVPSGDEASVRAISHRADIPVAVSPDAVETLRKAQQRGAFVAFVSDSAAAAEAFANADLAIAIGTGRRGFPARVDVLAPDLSAVAAIVEAGARHDAAVRDSVYFSAMSNLFGASWGWLAKPGIERASLPVYMGMLSAVSDGLVRLAGGKRPGASLAYLIDPHPERWGQLDVDDVLRALQTTRAGLTTDEARRRRRTVPRKARRQELIGAVYDQFRYPTTTILVGAAGLSLVVGRALDFVIIGATIGVNVVVGVWQEWQANQAADVIKKLSTTTARGIRDGRTRLLPATQLVSGDLLLLQPGDRVPADVRLLESRGLEVDEAVLTGESFPVAKDAQHGVPEHRVVLEGSDVVVGTARAVAVAVGRETRMGVMAAAMDVDETERSPLGHRLGSLLWQSFPLTAAASGTVVLAGLLHRRPLGPQLMIAATMALAAVPEGLPLLAGMGQGGVARRLARRRALVRRLSAVEALGRVDIACVDKTGTMTEGRLAVSLVADAVSQASCPGQLSDNLLHVLRVACWASPHPDAAGAAAHPTDVAVVRAAEQAGLEIDVRQLRAGEAPFEPNQSFHAVVVSGRFCAKGAPEILLDRCTRIRRGSREEPLAAAGQESLAAQAEQLAAQGLRVLMVAEAGPETDLGDPQNLMALGFLGIRDPLRTAVRPAVARCHEAGVRVVMITGDHPATALNIARQAGLAIGPHALITGGEVAELDDDALSERLEHASVIARATPLDKLRIIESLQRRGHTVAMTGDGVNDAPALRLADVGVAMGRGGTEVARQTADVILADDDFATLVDALIEGRGFWQNMRRALGLLLGGNLGELGLIAGASVLGTHSPLNAAQILVVNLITDALPAVAIVMQQPEQRRLASLAREGLAALDDSLRTDVARRAALTAGPSLVACLLAGRRGAAEQASTVAFGSIVATQLAQTFEAGRLRGQFSQPVLGAVFASTGMLAATMTAPPLRGALRMAAPTPLSWALIGTSALSAALLSRLAPATNRSHSSGRLQSSSNTGIIMLESR